MRLSDFSIRRPVSISMIVLGVLLLGMVSVAGIPVNLLPEITFPRVTIRTEYPQAAPGEVENMVTRPIEQVVGVINRVVSISSISRSGLSDVVVEFEWGTDLDLATMEMREKLQMLQFPDDVEKPLILRYDPSRDPVMTLGITGDMRPSELRYFVENEIQLPLERLDGVAAVTVQGGLEDEILISVDEARASSLGISMGWIADRLKKENVNLAGGTLRDADSELAVRTTNAFTGLDDIKNLVIVARGEVPSAEAGDLFDASAGETGEALSSLMGIAGLPAGPLAGGMPPATFGARGTPREGLAASVRLKDIADVVRRPKKRDEIARLNGGECVQVSIYKEGDANVVAVCRRLKNALDKIRASLARSGRREAVPTWGEIRKTARTSPLDALGWAKRKLVGEPEGDEPLVSNVRIIPVTDQAEYIEKAIGAVYTTGLWGVAIAVIVLYFFLRSAVSTFIITVSIPTSIIATFNLMYFFHISWNIMSLGGLALGIGMLVDNSIVVTENIFRIRESGGGGAEDTASKGASQVGTAITASTITNIAVFFPIVFVVGVAGQIFRDLALTVTFSLVLSELAAFTLVPMLSVVSGAGMNRTGVTAPAESARPAEIGRLAAWTAGSVATAGRSLLRLSGVLLSPPLAVFDRGYGLVKRVLPRVHERVLARPGYVMAGSAGLSLASLLVFLILGFELLPSVDQGKFTVNLELPTGTPIERTDRKVRAAEAAFDSLREKAYIDNIFSNVGYGVSLAAGAEKKAENLAEVQVMLERERPLSDVKIMDMVRAGLRRVLAGVKIKMSRPTLLSYKTPIKVEITGNNLEELGKLADLVVAEISEIPGIHDVESSGRRSNPEVHVLIDRDRAASMGLTPARITDEIRRKVKGEVATDLDEGERQVDIVVRVREQDRADVARLGDLGVPRPGGAPVPLKVLAVLDVAQGPGVINRSGNSRVSLVTADLSGRPLGDVVADIGTRLEKLNFPPGYYWRITGQNEEMRRSLASLAGATLLAVVLVYIVLASLFESLVHPFVIMFTVPYSLVGVALMLLLTGASLNVFSFIGIMMMVGIAVNDAIVYVERINQCRREGMERKAAIIRAGEERLRPILITTLTTVLAMVPMALIGGEGAEMRAPIAIGVIGGLLSATFFTLTCIPAVYLVLDRLRPGGGVRPPKSPGEKLE